MEKRRPPELTEEQRAILNQWMAYYLGPNITVDSAPDLLNNIITRVDNGNKILEENNKKMNMMQMEFDSQIIAKDGEIEVLKRQVEYYKEKAEQSFTEKEEFVKSLDKQVDDILKKATYKVEDKIYEDNVSLQESNATKGKRIVELEHEITNLKGLIEEYKKTSISLDDYTKALNTIHEREMERDSIRRDTVVLAETVLRAEKYLAQYKNSTDAYYKYFTEGIIQQYYDVFKNVYQHNHQIIQVLEQLYNYIDYLINYINMLIQYCTVYNLGVDDILRDQRPKPEIDINSMLITEPQIPEFVIAQYDHPSLSEYKRHIANSYAQDKKPNVSLSIAHRGKQTPDGFKAF